MSLKIHFTGHSCEITNALKQFTEEKMLKLQHHDNQITKISVHFVVEKVLQIAEGTVHLDGKDFHATGESKDMLTSIDMLVEKLLAQVDKHKEKSTNHHR